MQAAQQSASHLRLGQTLPSPALWVSEKQSQEFWHHSSAQYGSHGKPEKMGHSQIPRKSPGFLTHKAAQWLEVFISAVSLPARPGPGLCSLVTAILVPRASVFYHAPRTLYFLLSLPRNVSLLVYRTHSCSFCKSDSSQSCLLFMMPTHSSCSTNTS